MSWIEPRNPLERQNIQQIIFSLYRKTSLTTTLSFEYKTTIAQQILLLVAEPH